MSDPPLYEPSRAADSPAGAVIAASLVELEHSNPAAHALLVSHCEEGFFEGQPGKRSINQLAEQLLATIQEAGHAD